jgi:hypothetical protein
MMRKSCSTTTTARRLLSVLSLAGALSSLVFVLSACEDKAIGRRCDVTADAGTIGAMQAVFNGQAVECPTRICLKPTTDQAVAMTDTAPYCTAECSSDSDCDGETRDRTPRKPGEPPDLRCKGGFVCGIGFEVGPLCCKKICLCKDFLPKGGLPPVASCDKSKGVSTCTNL